MTYGDSITRVDGQSAHVRNIALDLILTLITFGLFNLRVQSRQMLAVNAMLREEKYSFWMWLLFTIVTFGLYHIYHEYRKTADIARVHGEANSYEPLITVLLTMFGLFFVADAIQQAQINRYFGSTRL